MPCGNSPTATRACWASVCTCAKEANLVVSKISFPVRWQTADLASLVSRSQTQLQHLDLCTGFMFEAAVNQRRLHPWPVLRNLTIYSHGA